MSGTSRRTVAKGMAWSIPTVALASTAPAVAASGPCTPASQAAIDARLNTSCRDSKLTFNIYQPIAQISNNSAVTINLNIRNDGACSAYFDCSDPLVVKIQLRDINTGCARSITSSGTSWGTLTNDGYDSANHLRNFTWSFCGEIKSGAEADLQIGLGDGGFCGGLFGQQTTYMTYSVPTLKPPAAPALTSILTATNQQTACSTYYTNAIAQYQENSKIKFYYEGPLQSGGPLTAGQTLDSRVTGNGVSAGGARQKDGIW